MCSCMNPEQWGFLFGAELGCVDTKLRILLSCGREDAVICGVRPMEYLKAATVSGLASKGKGVVKGQVPQFCSFIFLLPYGILLSWHTSCMGGFVDHDADVRLSS